MVMIVLPDAADVMMMTHLRLADRGLEAGQVDPILAQLAVHVWTAVHRFLGPLRERLIEEWMHVEIAGTQVFGRRMVGRKLLGLLTNPFLQDAGEEKERQD